MALRLIQAIIPLNRKDQLQNLIRGESFIESWDQTMGDSRYKLSFLLPAEESEHLISRLEQRFSDTATFRVIMHQFIRSGHFRHTRHQTCRRERGKHSQKYFPRLNRDLEHITHSSNAITVLQSHKF